MSLSSGLTLTDLSDYLAPSQLCIKPATMVEDTSPDAEQADVPFTEANAVGGSKAGRAQTQISIEHDGYYESGTSAGQRPKKLKKAEITLNDCLACSGCITSAESVLVSMQSHEEVYRVLAERPDLMPIVSIAPQSLASLAALHNLTVSATLKGLRRFFKKELGFRLAFDTTYARSLSLSESRLEFLSRSSNATTSTTSPSTSASPILSSSCPGWICYAEKTHGELLPLVSKVKSSQAIMGVLVKGDLVAGRLGKRPDEIYHVTVMPCYDKKLEASRPDFATPFQLPNAPSSSKTPPVRDVDCVLTTGEVERMLNDRSLVLEMLAKLEDDDMEVDEGDAEDSFFPSLLQSTGTSSGGYLYQTILATLSTLSEEELGRVQVVERRVKGEDYVEFLVVLSPRANSSTPIPSKTLLRAAKCYGFRNLQNLVRKVSRDAGINTSKGGAAGRLPSTIPGSSTTGAMTAAQRRANAMAMMKRKKDAAAGIHSTASSGTVTPVEEEVERSFDFVEVMACPGGCVNGGGQIAAPKTPYSARTALATTKVASNGRVEKVGLDDEGMPDFSRVGLLDEGEEMKGVMCVDGERRGEIVLSPKDWVKRVEEVYWEMEGPEHVVAVRVPDGMDDSVKEYYLEMKSSRNENLERLRGETLQVLLRDAGAGEMDRELKRQGLFRTEYRAVAEEEVNGLAVKW